MSKYNVVELPIGGHDTVYGIKIVSLELLMAEGTAHVRGWYTRIHHSVVRSFAGCLSWPAEQPDYDLAIMESRRLAIEDGDDLCRAIVDVLTKYADDQAATASNHLG